ncbi:MAG TPA: CBS domain-containing protein [Gemmatimonadales bacterium]|nr:CBS domain-containing protein [Gemmatimonadales bacterium]
MRVSEIMTTDVVTIRGDATLSEAVEMLADTGVSGLAVVDHHNKLVGVLSTTDVLNAEAEAGDETARARILEGTLVSDLMTTPVLTIGPDTDVREASLQMEYGEVHRLFVEQDGQLAGVVSHADIVRAHAGGRL